MELKFVDKDGSWFINVAAFPLNDPITGHTFVPGIKYKIKQSDWMAAQETIRATDEDDEAILDEVLIPAQPGDRALNLNEVNEAGQTTGVAEKPKSKK